MGLFEFTLLSITSLIAVIEPASNVAIFVSLTEDTDLKKQRRIVGKSMRISFLVLAFFAIAGSFFFSLFNITVAAFRIAGGLLLVVVALKMLNPRKDEYSQTELEDVSIVPLAFPLTAGPGSIATVMLLVSQAVSIVEVLAVFLGIFVGILVQYIGMRYASRISKFAGKEGLRVVTRLMSIIVLAIAVQFVINGIAGAIPQIIP